LIAETWELLIRDLKKWVRSPAWIISSLIQPVLWLILFGNAFNPTNMIPSFQGSASVKSSILDLTFGGAPNYISFLTAGMLCFLMVSWAIWAGGPLVTDRTLGYLDKLLVAPIPRSAITFSLVISSLLKGLVLSIILLGIALILPGGLVFSPGVGALGILGIFGALMLLALGFLWLCIGLAVRISKFETLAAIGATIGLPLLFASTALLPATSMPTWLRDIANVNPISKAADIIRYFIINGTLNNAQLGTVLYDFAYLGAFVVICAIIGIFVSDRGLRME
jgi:ABC-2 type transport system permease protein